MTAIGGKHKAAHKAEKPQVVVQRGYGVNEYAKFGFNPAVDAVVIDWVGDPNAATKFDSKYHAKSRIREYDVPVGRIFKVLT